MVSTELPSLRSTPLSISHRDNGHSSVSGGEDRLQSLQRNLEFARTEQTTVQIVQPLCELGQCYLDQFKLGEARSHFTEALAILRVLNDKDQAPSLANVLRGLATAEHYLGNPEAAIASAAEAERQASEIGNFSVVGQAFCVQGASLCYSGCYSDGQAAFEQARSAFLHAGDLAGIAEEQTLYAREYARDQGQYEDAIDRLEKLVPTLREPAKLEGLLTLADSYLRYGNAERANELCQQIEELVLKGKRFWYRPEFYLIKARTASALAHFEEANHYARSGLSAAGAYGDLRLLSPLYRELASILQRDRSRADDAYDALERAILSAQVRGRKLDLALALQAAGIHLKRFANRPTLRARGSGFLFKADGLFNQMKLPTPGLNLGPTAPLDSETAN